VNTYGVYKVIGKREYRGHAPGSTFEARIDRPAEQRAIERGDIELVQRVEITVPAQRTFPQGWLPPMLEPDTAPTSEAKEDRK